MLHKRDIDAQVAMLLGLRQVHVSLVTYTFIRVLSLRLIEKHELYLDGFGLLRLFKNKIGWMNIRVSKSRSFTQMLKDNWRTKTKEKSHGQEGDVERTDGALG